MYIKDGYLIQGSNRYKILKSFETTVKLFSDKGKLKHGEKKFAYDEFRLSGYVVDAEDNLKTLYYRIVGTDMMNASAIVKGILVNGSTLQPEHYPMDAIHTYSLESTLDPSQHALEDCVKHIKRDLIAARASMELN